MKSDIKNLAKEYNSYLYNLALRLVYNDSDAKDLTSDVWIKVLQSIDKFEKKSDFKTWAYRIMINEFLNQKRKTTELRFSDFATTMSSMEDNLLSDNYSEPDRALLINEAKVGCMMGMLLCLDREQRAIFIIGDIFDIKSDIGAKIFNITKENFRKKLSRARADLYSFMNNHCSLVNKTNSCRCELKTKALIEAGYVDPNSLLFDNSRQKELKNELQIKSDNLDNIIENLYKKLYQSHPFVDIDEELFANNLLKHPKIRSIFEI
jgi:RNA polymerase sigma factor (sigma-70 family)